MTPPAFPQEIYDLIVEHIGNNRQALTTCAIAHRDFTQSCHRRLFQSICLQIPNGRLHQIQPSNPRQGTRRYCEQRCDTLKDIFLRNPSIMQHVRRVKVLQICAKSFGDFPSMPVARAVSGLLNQLGSLDSPKLQSLQLASPRRTCLRWEDIPIPVQLAVFGLRHCTTLIELELRNIQGVPIFILESWTRLKSFSLYHSSLIERTQSENENGSNTSTPDNPNPQSMDDALLEDSPNLLQLTLHKSSLEFSRIYSGGYLKVSFKGLQRLQLSISALHATALPLTHLIDGTASTLRYLNLRFESTGLHFYDWAINLSNFPCLQDLMISIFLDPICSALQSPKNDDLLVIGSENPVQLKNFCLKLCWRTVGQDTGIMEHCRELTAGFYKLNRLFTASAFPQLTNFRIELEARRKSGHQDPVNGWYLESTLIAASDYVQTVFPNVSGLSGFAVVSKGTPSSV
ncbi:hypothetical protein CVT24_011724 [Panaeolus cyanescens]|uniref:F-box domain-containing protein n=1 Tax=Panaeolus cyanescens TaxID=181874 RepID=A0A409YHC3_9AGAR|nr:hypothetical protein CVT24_011724 [Panaeolus cyanescens]